MLSPQLGGTDTVKDLWSPESPASRAAADDATPTSPSNRGLFATRGRSSEGVREAFCEPSGASPLRSGLRSPGRSALTEQMCRGDAMRAALGRSPAGAEPRCESPEGSAAPTAPARTGEGMRQALGHCPSPTEHSARVKSQQLRGHRRSRSTSDDGEGHTSPSLWSRTTGDDSRASPTAPRTPLLPTRSLSRPPKDAPGSPQSVARRVVAPPWNARRSGSPLLEEGAPRAASPRLRGEGLAIGQRGLSSSGISWRHLPAYSSEGKLGRTGDAFGAQPRQTPPPDGASREAADERSMPSAGSPTSVRELREDLHPRRIAVFSRRCGGGEGAQELLSPSSSAVAEPWSAARWALSPTRDRSPSQAACWPEAGYESRHAVYRPQKLRAAPASATPDSSPISQEGSPGGDRPAVPTTPHVRVPLSPPAALVGAGAQPLNAPPGEMPTPVPQQERKAEMWRDRRMELSRVVQAGGSPAVVRRVVVVGGASVSLSGGKPSAPQSVSMSAIGCGVRPQSPTSPQSRWRT